MSSDQRDERLEAGLRDLGLHLGPDLDGPEPADVVDAVRRRIAATAATTETQPAPPGGKPTGTKAGTPHDSDQVPKPATPGRSSGGRVSKPRIAIAVLAFLTAFGTAAAVSPQVRAAVTKVLRFAGVEVHNSPAPTPVTPLTSPTLPGEQAVDLTTARARAAFPVAIPSTLGTPERVTISDGTPPRVVSLFYVGIRIDEFDGTVPSYYFAKYSSINQAEPVTINGTPGVWVPGPQDVIYVDRAGQELTSTAHHADGTLVWQHGDVTLRIESSQGALDKAHAVAIAHSATP